MATKKPAFNGKKAAPFGGAGKGKRNANSSKTAKGTKKAK